MINPIEKIKKEKDLTNRELALMLGQSVGNVSHLLMGSHTAVPDHTLEVIKTLGYDPKKVQKDYQRFRQEKAKAVIERVAVC
ncbi:MAG TPA: hypothetical protein P5107_10545 [Thermotogota bacterium]|nr:hypothetical protein [Thermotogota bacterium]